MITLFVIVVVGYAAGKLRYMGGDFDRKLSSLVINWTCPALILSSSMTGDLPDRQYILPLLGISVLTYVVLTALAWGFSRLLTKRIEHRGILSFAMVFILPSLYEGFAIVALEAQATGLPVLVSDTVPRDVKLTDNVIFLSLKEKPYEQWINEILRLQKRQRTSCTEQIIQAGYDISNTAEIVRNIYLN